MKKQPSVIIAALLFSVGILWLGYAAFGLWTTLIFTSGFLGGFILWLLLPSNSDYKAIRTPYFVTLGLFLLHRIEEKVSGFFDALAQITKVATPEILSWQVILLVLTSVGAWLMIPYLVKRQYAIGFYLAWTFFAAMGITELAHFIFPLFTDCLYGYFPGMASVVVLAPVAWWGMYRLSRQSTKNLHSV